MSWVNGDAIAAKLGATGRETGVTVRGRNFPMPPSLPLVFPVLLQMEDISGALRSLFGEQWEDLIRLAGAEMSVDWLREVVEQVYGDGSGEASASAPTSPPTNGAGGLPRPISAVTTG